MTTINKIFAIILAAVTISFASCVKDADYIPVKNDADNTLVRLSITTPQPSTPKKASSRADVDMENLVSNVTVLVFGLEGGTYRYRYMAEAQNLTPGDAYTTFSALLRTSSENLKLMLAANSAPAFQSQSPSYGQSESEVKAMLTVDFNSALQTTLPMWGEVVLANGLEASGANINVTMLRAIARVDVVKTLAEGSYAFDLQSVHLFRTNNKIQLIPDALVSGALRVAAPSVPSSSAFNAGAIVNNTKTDEGGGVEAIRKSYVPEAASNTSDKLEGVTSVIIGGYFNNETTLSYYRIDFDSKIDGHPFGQILRNHRYTFNVVKVLGRGWSTPEDAAHNVSTNVTATIQSWEDFLTDMVFDWEHHFGVSSRTLPLEPQANSTDSIDVVTDITNYTIEWADQDGNGLGNAAGLGTEIQNAYFRASASADGKSIKVTALQSNESASSIRKDYILIRANRFKILLTINQNFVNRTLKTVKVLSFRTGLAYLGTSMQGAAHNAEIRARGLRGILTNTANFGPGGTVKITRVWLSDIGLSDINSLTEEYLNTFDVVYVPLIPTASINSATAQTIVNWLRNSDKRFLVLTNDLADHNRNFFSPLGLTGGVWFASGTPPYNIASDTDRIKYFLQDGPFTRERGTSIPSTFTFRKYDVNNGELNIAQNPEYAPILTGAGGNMVLGMSFTDRVLYVGDIDLFNAEAGSGATLENRLTNTTGVINNNAALLIANVWAYIAETVTSN